MVDTSILFSFTFYDVISKIYVSTHLHSRGHNLEKYRIHNGLTIFVKYKSATFTNEILHCCIKQLYFRCSVLDLVSFNGQNIGHSK